MTDPNGWVDPLGLDERTYITYQGIDAKTGKPYVGYASMPGSGHSFREVLNYRYGGDFSRFSGGQPPSEIYVGPDKETARGLEQRVFEDYGGLDGTANRQNPVGPNNSRRDEYLAAADKHRNKNQNSIAANSPRPDNYLAATNNNTGGCKGA